MSDNHNRFINDIDYKLIFNLKFFFENFYYLIR